MEQAEARGFHALSIDGVAKAAGISRPIVYQHFGDLTGLLNAVVDREGERAVAQLGDPPPHRGHNRSARAAHRGSGSVPRGRERRAGPVAPDPDAAGGRPRGDARALRARTQRSHRQLATVVGPAVASTRGAPSPDAELLARSLQALAEELARATLETPAGTRSTACSSTRAGRCGCSRSSPPRRDSAAPAARVRGDPSQQALELQALGRLEGFEKLALRVLRRGLRGHERFAPALVSATTWRRRSARVARSHE